MIYASGRAAHPGFKANVRVFEVCDFLTELLGFVPDALQHESVAYGLRSPGLAASLDY